jgi:hypothetical protein
VVTAVDTEFAIPKDTVIATKITEEIYVKVQVTEDPSTVVQLIILVCRVYYLVSSIAKWEVEHEIDN